MTENTQEELVHPENAPALNVQDLVMMVNIIQAATSRGAFRAEELSTTGALYDKLVAFLDSVGVVSKEDPSKEQ